MKRVNYEDLVLDLYILRNLNTGGGRKKIAKILFLLEEELLQKNSVGPYYVMKKYPMGPYNNAIKRQLENLSFNGYIKHSNRYWSTSTTEGFIYEIEDLFQEFSWLFNTIDDLIENFGEMNGDDIATYIYSLSSIGSAHKPFDFYEDYEEIINPKKIKNPKQQFLLDDDWYDTLDILLNPKKFLAIKKSLKDCKVGNFTISEESLF
ncbi:hypothetical protein LCGC14_1642110 [marine sediment metagenome]|uniref:Antitoxin SocA-like Panacea domain-containing protein n=1 Tax=marine sediment metagenome TaxID=412755 RepID=A0A0F9KF49_9ZZZZ|nr:hypothetical protein [bacterium]